LTPHQQTAKFFIMKRTYSLRYLLVVALVSGVMVPRSAQATFTAAAADLRDSSAQGSLAMYYGLLSLLYDSNFLTYYSYIYMDAAKSLALRGYQKSSSANAASSSLHGSLTITYSYYDWYYKSQASLWLYYAYIYPSFYYSSQSITNGYFALYYSSFSAYYAGLASAGGAK
jgi:hypothetical protein